MATTRMWWLDDEATRSHMLDSIEDNSSRAHGATMTLARWRAGLMTQPQECPANPRNGVEEDWVAMACWLLAAMVP